MEYDIFISYSRQDYPIVKRITNALDAGKYSYFIDREGIAAGEEFKHVIINAIRNSKLVLFISSENSNKSQWTRNEISFAERLEKIIVPVRIDNSEYSEFIDFFLLDTQYIDLVGIHDSAEIEKRLLGSIGKILGRSSDETYLTDEQRRANLEAARERRDGPQDYIPQKINTDIFISYRRLDGRDYARSVMQGLKINGYPNIFFDYNSLRDGVFNTQIIDAIYSCNDFILVISPLALKNCSREGDWVTKEIRLALKYQKKIIPVVIEDTFQGWPEDFPEDLSPIKNIHFHQLKVDEYFEYSIEMLTKRLTTAASTEQTSFKGLDNFSEIEQPTKERVYYKIKVDRKCRLFIDEEEIQILEASQLAKIPLPKGEYIRKIVDFDNGNILNEATLLLNSDKAEIISTNKSLFSSIFQRMMHPFVNKTSN